MQFKRSIKIKHTIVIVKVSLEGGSFIINRNKNNKAALFMVKLSEPFTEISHTLQTTIFAPRILS